MGTAHCVLHTVYCVRCTVDCAMYCCYALHNVYADDVRRSQRRRVSATNLHHQLDNEHDDAGDEHSKRDRLGHVAVVGLAVLRAPAHHQRMRDGVLLYCL
jgi:hypothetical protein